ncbi:hybrid sensor histidine kinase/response regulator [Egicoccus halophilus]|uniref:hybrid sensor histidine kinase/response regulator n=1 Tax=Egicoccus halophilus TaxID=1670830 RepID=UPI00102FE1E6|nr:ATP-binding protein [Egicoccus halophilus]
MQERARLSEQLAQAQRLDLAGRLAGGVAHDLKNLITVLSSYLDLASGSVQDLAPRVGDGPVETILDDLDQIRQAVDRTEALARKLMEFAGGDGATEPVDLHRAVASVHARLAPALAEGVTVELDLPDDLPAVRVDTDGLEQALEQLLRNSNDALPEGGTIVVRARVTDTAAPGGFTSGPRPPLDAGRRHVRLAVLDDGTGMEDETLTRAFEPLFSTKPGARGSGLGLPTVLSFVQQIDGMIDVHSVPGEGTTIALALPVATDDVDVDERPVGDGAGRLVVLVDPNERARRLVTEMLATAGHRVLACADGETGLRLLEQQGGDVLVAELALPGLPGWRLVERARASRPRLPVLLFTSGQAPTRTTADVRMLVKPFSSERLLQTLDELAP